MQGGPDGSAQISVKVGRIHRIDSNNQGLLRLRGTSRGQVGRIATKETFQRSAGHAFAVAGHCIFQVKRNSISITGHGLAEQLRP